jgi:hypothetical protein
MICGMVLGFGGCGLGFGSPRDPVGVLCDLICERLTYERRTEESLRFAGA